MQITSIQKNKINKLGLRYNLKLILLYGSYAAGTNNDKSDLDIAVLGKKPLEFRQLLKINLDLQTILSNHSQFEIDLASLHKDDPLFRYEVVKNSKLLFGTELEYSEFEAYAFQSYFDAKDLFRLQRILIDKYQNHLNQTYA